MRAVVWYPMNQYGDAMFVLTEITPPDEVEARAKYLAEEPARRAERLKNASPETLARIAEIKARI